MLWKQWPLLSVAALLTVAGVGCNNAQSSPRTASGNAGSGSATAAVSAATLPPNGPSVAVPVAVDATEHGHKPGAHGGIMVSLGRDSYHMEAVFEKGGVLRLYALGKDESRVIDIENQTLKAFVKAEGDAEAQPFSLQPAPQDGDADGRTSQFLGELPKGLWGQNLNVTVPNIVIAGERFRLGFNSTSEQHDEGMPDKVADDEERKLYLTPGGKYTEQDIKANGNVTASIKFKGLKSSHDMFPKTGDKICPVTKTKANPKFAWVVDGKTYEFCCPPCVDEFVKTAKAAPEEIKAPTDYVKRQ